jgi:hypothetical protein
LKLLLQIFISSSFKETFKECRKNHASRIGSYALDGCEFLFVETEETEGTIPPKKSLRK